MAKKAVTTNGEKIKALRTSKGWSAEDLAAKTELNLKTIRTAESGKGVYITSLNIIATILDVEVGLLIARQQNRKLIKVTTYYEFENFTQAEYEAFEQMLLTRNPSCGAIVLREVSQGSTVLIIEMDEDDIAWLVATWKASTKPEGEKKSGDLSVITALEVVPEDPALPDHHNWWPGQKQWKGTITFSLSARPVDLPMLVQSIGRSLGCNPIEIVSVSNNQIVEVEMDATSWLRIIIEFATSSSTRSPYKSYEMLTIFAPLDFDGDGVYIEGDKERWLHCLEEKYTAIELAHLKA